MDFQTPLELEAALSRGNSPPVIDGAVAAREAAAAASVAAAAADAEADPYIPIFPMQQRGPGTNGFPAKLVDPEAEKVSYLYLDSKNSNNRIHG